MPRKKAKRLKTTPYSTLVDQAGDAFFVHNLVDGTPMIVDVNAKACELLGYPRAELLTKTIMDISAEFHPPRANQLWETARAGEPVTFDTHLRRKDGSVFPAEITLSALRLPNRTYYLGVVRDLSERRARDQSYKHLMESMNDAALVIDQDGKFVEVNQKAVRLLGYSRSDLLGMTPSDLAEGLDPKELQATLEDVISGHPRLEEVLHRTADGRTIPVEASMSATTYMGRDAVLSLVRDVSHRKLVEDSLLKITQRTQAILQTIPDIIAEVDENKVYTWANPAALEFFGDDMIGREAADFFVGDQNTYSRVQPLFSGDADSEYVESWQRRKDGQNRLLVWWCRVLRDSDGRVTGALSTARDITERRHEETVRDSRLRILEAAPGATVDDFLQNVLRELEILTSSPIGFCNFMINDGEVFTTASWASLEDTEECEVEPPRLHRVISKAGVWADCARQRRPVVYNDLSTAPGRKGTPPGHTYLERILTVPVFHSDKIVAVFAVGNKPSDYTEQDVETVESLIDLAWYTVARKQAETALQESDTRNRRLFDSSPHAVLLSDPGGHFLDCNQTAIDTYGYSREELLMMTYRDLAAPSLRDQAGQHVAETLEMGGTVFEWRHRRKDGSELPVEIKTAPFTTQGGQRIIATVRDLTESKAAQEALRASEERFKNLSSMAKEGIVVHENGIIVDANRAFAELIGFTDPDELIGKNGLELLPTSDETRALIRRRMQAGSDEAYEIELTGPGDSKRWAETGASNIVYRDRPARLVFMRDVTEAKTAQLEHERLQEQLKQAAKMESIGRLAGGVAHDFNNMLAVILGHVALALEQVPANQPLHADLQEIRSAAEHSATITQQLLAFARRQVAAPKVVDPNAAIEATLAMLRRLIGERASLTWLPGDDLGNLEIDPAQLEQILVNLSLNARDAISGSGHLRIATSRRTLDEDECEAHDGCSPGTYIALAIEDDGSGMTPEATEHMFEPFFTTKEVGEGTGLGLATVYGIVRQNNGFIDVRSEEGRGTTVTVFLPRTDAPFSPDTSPPPRPHKDAAQPGKETLLVVEDEPSVLRLASRILRNHDYQVLAAETPDQALALVRDHPGEIALAITDVVMPEMTGWDLSDRLRQLRPAITILYVSGYTDEILADDEHFNHGINFLKKPFTPQQLAEAVRTSLDQRT